MRPLIALTVFACSIGILAPAIARPALAAPGYSLTLAASPTGASPADRIGPGTTITYRIEHTEPANPGYAVYQFITPTGTTFVSAQAVSGATVTVQTSPPTAKGTSASGQADVRVTAAPTAPTGGVVVKVRVNDIWQGSVTAQAYFVATGLGGSNVVSQDVDLGDGVPGQVVTSSFVDMNGNGVADPEDLPESCPVYAYADLTGQHVPDDLTGATDPRLPLVSYASTDEHGIARIDLLQGRYAVYFGACNSPSPPGGALTSVDVIDVPPATRITSQSGTNSYEVQVVRVASTQVTDVVHAEHPVGPTPAPSELRIDGLLLTWVDNAEGEASYRVEIQSQAGGGHNGAFSLPPNSTRFAIPSELLAVCGFTDLGIAVSAIDDNGGVGFPARTELRSIADCPGPSQVLAPNTGTGPQPPARPRFLVLAAVAALGVAFLTFGARAWHR